MGSLQPAEEKRRAEKAQLSGEQRTEWEWQFPALTPCPWVPLSATKETLVGFLPAGLLCGSPEHCEGSTGSTSLSGEILNPRGWAVTSFYGHSGLGQSEQENMSWAVNNTILH